LAILKRLSQYSPLVDWHKLTYLELMCRKTPINQSILILICRSSAVFPLPSHGNTSLLVFIEPKQTNAVDTMPLIVFTTGDDWRALVS